MGGIPFEVDDLFADSTTARRRPSTVPKLTPVDDEPFDVGSLFTAAPSMEGVTSGSSTAVAPAPAPAPRRGIVGAIADMWNERPTQSFGGGYMGGFRPTAEQEASANRRFNPYANRETRKALELDDLRTPEQRAKDERAAQVEQIGASFRPDVTDAAGVARMRGASPTQETQTVAEDRQRRLQLAKRKQSIQQAEFSPEHWKKVAQRGMELANSMHAEGKHAEAENVLKQAYNAQLLAENSETADTFGAIALSNLLGIVSDPHAQRRENIARIGAGGYTFTPEEQTGELGMERGASAARGFDKTKDLAAPLVGQLPVIVAGGVAGRGAAAVLGAGAERAGFTTIGRAISRMAAPIEDAVVLERGVPLTRARLVQEVEAFKANLPGMMARGATEGQVVGAAQAYRMARETGASVDEAIAAAAESTALSVPIGVLGEVGVGAAGRALGAGYDPFGRGFKQLADHIRSIGETAEAREIGRPRNRMGDVNPERDRPARMSELGTALDQFLGRRVDERGRELTDIFGQQDTRPADADWWNAIPPEQLPRAEAGAAPLGPDPRESIIEPAQGFRPRSPVEDTVLPTALEAGLQRAGVEPRPHEEANAFVRMQRAAEDSRRIAEEAANDPNLALERAALERPGEVQGPRTLGETLADVTRQAEQGEPMAVEYRDAVNAYADALAAVQDTGEKGPSTRQQMMLARARQALNTAREKYGNQIGASAVLALAATQQDELSDEEKAMVGLAGVALGTKDVGPIAKAADEIRARYRDVEFPKLNERLRQEHGDFDFRHPKIQEIAAERAKLTRQMEAEIAEAKRTASLPKPKTSKRLAELTEKAKALSTEKVDIMKRLSNEFLTLSEDEQVTMRARLDEIVEEQNALKVEHRKEEKNVERMNARATFFQRDKWGGGFWSRLHRAILDDSFGQTEAKPASTWLSRLSKDNRFNQRELDETLRPWLEQQGHTPLTKQDVMTVVEAKVGQMGNEQVDITTHTEEGDGPGEMPESLQEAIDEHRSNAEHYGTEAQGYADRIFDILNGDDIRLSDDEAREISEGVFEGNFTRARDMMEEVENAMRRAYEDDNPPEKPWSDLTPEEKDEYNAQVDEYVSSRLSNSISDKLEDLHNETRYYRDQQSEAESNADSLETDADWSDWGDSKGENRLEHEGTQEYSDHAEGSDPIEVLISLNGHNRHGNFNEGHWDNGQGVVVHYRARDYRLPTKAAAPDPHIESLRARQSEVGRRLGELNANEIARLRREHNIDAEMTPDRARQYLDPDVVAEAQKLKAEQDDLQRQLGEAAAAWNRANPRAGRGEKMRMVHEVQSKYGASGDVGGYTKKKAISPPTQHLMDEKARLNREQTPYVTRDVELAEEVRHANNDYNNWIRTWRQKSAKDFRAYVEQNTSPEAFEAIVAEVRRLDDIYRARENRDIAPLDDEGITEQLHGLLYDNGLAANVALSKALPEFSELYARKLKLAEDEQAHYDNPEYARLRTRIREIEQEIYDAPYDSRGAVPFSILADQGDAIAVGVKQAFFDAVNDDVDRIAFASPEDRMDLASLEPEAANLVYGELIPSTIRQIGRWLGEKIEFEPVERDGFTVQSVKLTPELKSKIKKWGLPLLGVAALIAPEDAEAQGPGGAASGGLYTTLMGGVAAGAALMYLAEKRGARRLLKENVELQKALMLDDLSGLANKRAFYRAQASVDADEGTAWATFDGNRFKKLNDAHGHAAGDKAIQHFGQVIRDISESMQIPMRGFRPGGDEFAFAVPKEKAAEFIRRVEEASQYTHGDVTTSLTGAAGDTFEQADNALNEIKDRNRKADPTLNRLAVAAAPLAAAETTEDEDHRQEALAAAAAALGGAWLIRHLRRENVRVPDGAEAIEWRKARAQAGDVGNPHVRDLASQYLQEAGITPPPVKRATKIDVDYAERVARWYDQGKSDPTDPQVQKAYQKFVEETAAQYEVMKRAGIKIEPVDVDPYPNSAAMQRDVFENKRLRVFNGDPGHPLLTQEENTIFRAVHDFFGHAKEGNQFGPLGEEQAYREHSVMYSDLAREAMATETRGQNSWVNYGPYGEANRANQKQTRYAEQKAMAMPRGFATFYANPVGPALRELARFPSAAALAGVGVVLAENDDPDLQRTGLPIMALAALSAVGSRRLAAGADKLSSTLFKTLARTTEGKAVARFFNPDRLLHPDVKEAVANYEAARARAGAKAAEMARGAKALGPEGDRAVSDVIEGEQWEDTSGMSADDLKAVLTFASALDDEYQNAAQELIDSGARQPSELKENYGGKRVYAYHEAHAAQKEGGPGSNVGGSPRIKGSKSRTLDEPIYAAEDALREAQASGDPQAIADAQSALDEAKLVQMSQRVQLGEIRESSYRAAISIEQAYADAAAARLFAAIRNVPGAAHPEWVAAVDDLKAGRDLKSQATNAGDRQAAQQMIDDAKLRLAEISREFEKADGEYVTLPNSRSLGDLQGAVVNRDVAHTLTGFSQQTKYAKLLRAWKEIKTVFNPGTHQGNILSNIGFAHMEGLHMWEQPVYLKRAAQDMKRYGPATKALAEAGILNVNAVNDASQGVAASEMRRREGLEELLDTTRPETADVLRQEGITEQSRSSRITRSRVKGAAAGALLGAAKMYDDENPEETAAGAAVGAGIGALVAGRRASRIRTLYNNEDNIFRAAIWLKKVNQGMKPAEATEYTRNALGNFRSRSPALHMARSTVAPFILYPAKALPRFAQQVVDHPWRYAALMALWGGLNEYSQQEVGEANEHDIPLRDRRDLGYFFPGLTQLPFGNARGEKAAVDVARWTPLSAATTAAPPGSVPASFDEETPDIFRAGGPVVDLASRFGVNVDPFSGKPFLPRDYPPGENFERLVNSAAGTMLPSALDFHVERVKTDIENRDWDKAKNDLLGPTGLRPRFIRPGAVTMEARFTLTNSLREMKQQYRRDVIANRNPKQNVVIFDRYLRRVQQALANFRERTGLEPSSEDVRDALDVGRDRE